MQAGWAVPIQEIQARAQQCISPEALVEFLSHFEDLNPPWGYHPDHPISQWLIAQMTAPLHGQLFCEGHWESLAKVPKGQPIVLVCNHLSYGDAIILKCCLEHFMGKTLPIIGLAGPKAYETAFKKFMVMVMESIKIPQPTQGVTAGPSLKESARVLQEAIQTVRTYQQQGRMLQFFPEGGRSRTGSMIAFTPGSARFLIDEPTVYPIGLVGTERMMGVQKEDIAAQEVFIRVGAPIPWAELQAGLENESPNEKRKKMMDRLGYAVAELLPEHLRGVYDKSDQPPT